MNQKCLTTIFVPVQPLNFNITPPSICQKHQKPLSYYNKYKPDNDPICLDCLISETKEESDSNLYLPFSNLEQEYYYQKNAFFQIIEQANNMKKYDGHITNFQRLLTNFFSQFISKFLKDKIFINSNSPQKKVDFYEKNKTCLSPKDIMNILNKVENEKYILENKCADVFCQINKLQIMLLKNHEKLAESFKDLLNKFFEEPYGEFSNEKAKLKEHISNKTQLNKITSSLHNNSPKNTPEYLAKTQFETKTKSEDNISQFSPGDELIINFDDKIKEISNFTTNININMEKEKIFEENGEFDIEDEKKSINGNEINNSFSENKNFDFNMENNNIFEEGSGKIKVEKELEWRKKKNNNEELAWRRKKNDDDDIYLDHKEKINKLIEQDKNKKATVNQSFYQNKKPNFKKKSNLNKSYQKYKQPKYNFSKKIEYKQYNQFKQKTCLRCCSSFITTKNEEICQNCKYASDEDNHLNNRKIKEFSNKSGKYGFFSKNYIGQKKPHIPSRPGNKKMFGKKLETSFNRHFCNKTLIHSSSNFLSHHNNRMNSPKLYDENKRFFNSKFKLNRGKENYDDNRNGKFGMKKYNLSKNDDFEVDLESEEGNSKDESDKNDKNNNLEKSFFKETNDIFKSDFSKKNDDSMNDIERGKDTEDNKSEGSFNKKENNDGDENDDRNDNNNEDGVDDDVNDVEVNNFEADF